MREIQTVPCIDKKDDHRTDAAPQRSKRPPTV